MRSDLSGVHSMRFKQTTHEEIEGEALSVDEASQVVQPPIPPKTSLRKEFDTVVGQKSCSEPEVQRELLEHCRTYEHDDFTVIDEDDLLELLDYLVVEKDVHVRDVIAKVRCATAETRAHALHLIIELHREHALTHEVCEPQSQEQRSMAEHSLVSVAG